MATYAELQTNVQNLIIDLPPTVLASVPRLINSAIRSAQNRYNFSAMEGVSLFTTVDNQFTLGTIANFKEYRDQGPYLFRQNSRSKKLTTSTAPNAQIALLQTTQGEPKFITRDINITTGLNTFNVLPFPDSLSDWDDGLYQIVIPHYAFSASLVNSGDSNWFTLNMEDYIIYKAVGEGFGLDWDFDSMAIWLQRAEEKYKEARKADMTKKISATNELAIHWDGGLTPPVRW